MNKENYKNIINKLNNEPVILTGKTPYQFQINKDIFQKYKNYFINISEMLYCYKKDNVLDEMFCYCGNKKHFRDITYGYPKTCSKKCGYKIRNFESPFKRKDIQEKIKQTFQSKYNNDTFTGTKLFKEKSKLTKLKKYNNENYNNGKQASKTKYERYENHAYDKNKFEQSMLNKYNVKYISQTQKFKESRKLKSFYNKDENKYYNQIHLTNFDNLNKQYIENNFIKDNRFLIDDFVKYFNISYSASNRLKRKFNITIPNKIEYGHIQHEIFDYIKSIYNGEILYNTRKIIVPLEIDIYIPEKKIGIEFNGAYWHSINFGNKSIDYHYKKSILAKENNIDIIHIWEDQWLYQQDLIKSIIKVRLGLNKNKIFARKCIIKEITTQQYKDFTNKNHIQGYRQASIKLGLFYNNELVQIASFSKSRKYDYEWIRGCPASLNVVIGGTSKLFTYFIKNYKPKSVLCYADFNLFNGQGYKQCNFKLDGYTGPNKFYLDKNLKRIERNPHKYKQYKQLIENNQLLLCYGSGSLRYVWHK